MTPDQQEEVSDYQKGLIAGLIGPNVPAVLKHLRVVCQKDVHALKSIADLEYAINELSKSSDANTPETKKYLHWGESLRMGVLRMGRELREMEEITTKQLQELKELRKT